MDNNMDVTMAELESQGYKAVSCSKFAYGSKFSDKEKEYVLRSRERMMKKGMLLMVMSAMMTIIVCMVAFIPLVDIEPPVMRIVLPAIIGGVSLLGISMVLIRAIGPKKVAYATVLLKYKRRTRSRNASNMYIYTVIAYQSSPRKVYARNIYINRETYDKVNRGDEVIIIKNLIDNEAFINS